MENLLVFVGVLSVCALCLTCIAATVGLFLFKQGMRCVDDKLKEANQHSDRVKEMLPSLRDVVSTTSEGLAAQGKAINEIRQELSAMRMGRRS